MKEWIWLNSKCVADREVGLCEQKLFFFFFERNYTLHLLMNSLYFFSGNLKNIFK